MTEYIDREKRLKDYKGHQIWKMTEGYAPKLETVYMAYASDGEGFLNAAKTLKEIKDDIDAYVG